MKQRGGADDDEDSLNERDMPDASDMDARGADDAEDTLPCPFCRRGIWEKADICSHCGNFVAFPEETMRHRPVWFWIALVLAFVVLCLSVLLVRG
jgi:hypothetical protein